MSNHPFEKFFKQLDAFIKKNIYRFARPNILILSSMSKLIGSRFKGENNTLFYCTKIADNTDCGLSF
jgi:hypothetical protein